MPVSGRTLLIASISILLLAAGPARAAADAGILCQLATAEAEQSSGVPSQLLNAISRVESGRYDSGAGSIRGWPWTINAQGKGHYYDTKQQAVQAAHDFQTMGIQSIDVGCMQINLMYHPNGFSSLEEAFDPHANAVYAAGFLTDLFHRTGSWPHAAAAYHSQTPDLGTDYQQKVLNAWAEPIDRPSDSPRSDRSRRGPSHTELVATTASASTPDGSDNASPMGTRPLGGFGHIIRDRPGPNSLPPLAGVTGRSLAAYRARPVAVASLPPHGLRD